MESIKKSLAKLIGVSPSCFKWLYFR